ncbi:MAG: polysaccharide deacetylase family protein [Planctomycetota bacterium]|jgi:peptidoglycan/xylan/chitin deacetylase (PgdA/CDA1 family)
MTTTTIIILTTALLPASIAACIVVPYLVRLAQERRLARRCAAAGVLVLTYDDGPGPAVTARLIEMLRARGVRATFFLTGQRALEHANLADHLALEGHEVGCHTDRHRHPWRTWPRTSVRDIRDGYAALDRWMAPDAVFRPPHGKLTLLGLLEVVRRRAPIGWWTIDAGDTHRDLRCPQTLLDSVRRRGGGVVLMHDHHRDPQRIVHVLSLTASLLDLAADEGWTVCTLGELVRRAGAGPVEDQPAARTRRRAA